MITTIAVTVFAVAAAALLLYAFTRRRMTIKGVDDIPTYTHPVHMPAVLNLLDESQIEFLRDRLPPPDFNALQRKRIRVLIQYVDRMAANAAVLQRVGDVARHSADSRIASAAKELATLALQTRVYAFVARLQLFGTLLSVGTIGQVSHAAKKYACAVEHTELLVRFQRPERVHAISARL
ncbi:MAG: hypothetical protein ACE14L_00850 [Terriglobales bacterium]